MATAAIIGATGLVGQQLLKLLLASDRYEQVHYIGRRRVDIDSGKLVQHVMPLDQINSLKIDGRIDHAYCALGTTIDIAKSKENFARVDRDYVCAFAGWAIANGASAMAVNSSLGANAKSVNFYLHTKGEMEQCVRRAGFKSLTFVRPSLLVPTGRKQGRFGEEVSYFALKVFGWLMIGKLRRYKAVPPADVAGAMLNAVNVGRNGATIIESENIVPWSRGRVA